MFDKSISHWRDLVVIPVTAAFLKPCLYHKVTYQSYNWLGKPNKGLKKMEAAEDETDLCE